MHALVFAAGRGTRLRPYTNETPKPLLEVSGKPLLSHCMCSLIEAGVGSITIVVGYRGDQIRSHYGDSFAGIPLTYAQQDDRRGLAHAVITAETHIEGEVMCVNGDNVFDCDLSVLLERHQGPGVDGTILLDRVSRNEAESMAVCDISSDGTVRNIDSETADTLSTGYIAAGVQTHHGPTLVDACKTIDPGPTGEYELSDALATLVDVGHRYVGIELEGWHRNVNTPTDLEAVRHRFETETTEESSDA